MRTIKSSFILIVLALTLFVTVSVYAKYIPSSKDTKLPPKEVVFEVIENPADFQLLKETENFKFFFKDERDIIAIYDKRNQYLWKTGIDSPFGIDVQAACDDALPEEKEEVCVPIEDRLNALHTALGNSLITIEYYDTTNQIKFIPSAAASNVRSTLKQVLGDDSHYKLEVRFTKPKINIDVHIYFSDKGISYEIRHDEITGDEASILAGILITPFLGASGGKLVYYNPGMEYEFDGEIYFDKGEYSGDGTYLKDPVTGEVLKDSAGRPIKNEVPVPKNEIPGYVLVPDGSGALIRFNDHDTEISTYKGKVYGKDYSLNTTFYRNQPFYIEYKDPTMPVFGVAHGNKQAAFVAYATEGDENMEIIMTPDEGRNTNYNFAYPRFNYNTVYFQVYNKAGAGYHKTLDNDQKEKFDININYEFLAGDGTNDGLSADYVGMAKAYRNYLIEKNIITVNNEINGDIPIRLDFIMADAKRELIGFDDVVVTNIKDVEKILKDLKEANISNINSGLFGYQKGGITLGEPDEINYKSSIGTKKEFQSVINELKNLGIDVSLVQNFVEINEEQMSLRGTALRHATNWYTRTNVYDAESPINVIYYARAKKTSEWLNNHVSELKDLKPNSITVDGIQNILFSDFTDKLTSKGKTIEIYQKAMEKANAKYKINASNPNQYLWKYIDRYLNSPVYSSQFIVSTDTVPFLQLVLNGTMEMYAPYSNFSFYSESDMLRMIDYNVYPSFMLTEKPAYLLMSTNSANYYSTEYELYKPLIQVIYNEVNGALRHVINSEWINRTVLADGVIVNSYSNEKEIVINYTEEDYVYNGVTVKAKSYSVID